MAQPVDAKAFYGYLFEADKKPTKVLDALLRGIAKHIVSRLMMALLAPVRQILTSYSPKTLGIKTRSALHRLNWQTSTRLWEATMTVRAGSIYSLMSEPG